MASPTVTGSLNKSNFAPGEAMILTVMYGDADNRPVTVVIEVRDGAGNTSGPITVGATIGDPGAITVTDAERTWTKQSDTGSVAVYRAVA